LAYDALADYETALDDYQQAVRLRPNFAEPLSNKGAALEAIGQTEEALAAYLSAVENSPGFAAARYNAARLYAQLGDVDSCLSHLGRAIELAPELMAEADEDDDLGWALRLQRMKGDQAQGPASRGA
jgi:tetratricopeptide (TPR) repeat protein